MASVSRAQQRLGQTLRGKWRIDRLLGVGGSAAVYAATHRNGKRVAIKILHPELAASEDIPARFLREAYAVNAIDHPGVVSVLDDDVTDDGAPFLVMDLLEGESLDERRKRSSGTLPLPEVLSLAEQVLDVLAAAHAKGIVHRDLKPANLFITRDGRVCLLDFGIARLVDPKGEASTTLEGSMMGSPAYMPPEQAKGQWDLVDERSDLWGLGATMFALLSGRAVHPARTLHETLIASATRPAPPIASLVPDIPAPVALVIDRALAFEKARRWPDARIMLAALRLATNPDASDEEMTSKLGGQAAAEPRAPDEAAGLVTPLTRPRVEPGAPRPDVSASEERPLIGTTAATMTCTHQDNTAPPRGRQRRSWLFAGTALLGLSAALAVVGLTRAGGRVASRSPALAAPRDPPAVPPASVSAVVAPVADPTIDPAPTTPASATAAAAPPASWAPAKGAIAPRARGPLAPAPSSKAPSKTDLRDPFGASATSPKSASQSPPAGTAPPSGAGGLKDPFRGR